MYTNRALPLENAVEVGGLVGHIIGPLDCSSGCHTGVAFSSCSGSYPVALRKEGGRSLWEGGGKGRVEVNPLEGGGRGEGGGESRGHGAQLVSAGSASTRSDHTLVTLNMVLLAHPTQRFAISWRRLLRTVVWSMSVPSARQ